MEWIKSARLSEVPSWGLSVPPPLNDKHKVVQTIMSSERVRLALDRFLDQEDQQGIVFDKLLRTTKNLAEKLVAGVNPAKMVPAGLLVGQALAQIYEGISIDGKAVESIRAASRKGPVILLPTHRSHLDYILMTYILVTRGVQPPFVIAGDNLDFPVVGDFLHDAGAVFIRRKKEAFHSIYKAVFSEYISLLLSQKCLIECFIEGARSRSGKMLRPKIGFLKAVVESLDSNQYGYQAVSIFPIAISYDKLVEGSSYVQEMLGSAKTPESLSALASGLRKLIGINLGTIEIRVGEPLDLLSLMRIGKHNDPENRGKFILHLANRVLFECNRELIVPATSCVATILLTTFSRGIRIRDLALSTNWLKEELQARGAQTGRMFEAQNSMQVVERALKMLGRLTSRRNNMIFGFQGSEALELSIYRNQLLHWFVSESLIAVAVARNLPIPLPRAHHEQHIEVTMEMEEILRSVKFISKLLKFEFIYKPSPDIEDNFMETISFLVKRNILKVLENKISVGTSRRGYESFWFLCMLIWPFIDVYWITATECLKMKHDLHSEADFCKRISEAAAAVYYSGASDFYEVVSVDAIKNALQWFISEEFISETKVKNQKFLKSHANIESRSRLEVLVQEIPNYRKRIPTRSFLRVLEQQGASKL